MDKNELFTELVHMLNATLQLKNSKYGDSYSKIRDKYKENFPVILIRLEDKFNRLQQLMLNKDNGTADESVDDTLLDLAGYCILELAERKIEHDTRTGDC